jgi:hypothetical protein
VLLGSTRVAHVAPVVSVLGGSLDVRGGAGVLGACPSRWCLASVLRACPSRLLLAWVPDACFDDPALLGSDFPPFYYQLHAYSASYNVVRPRILPTTDQAFLLADASASEEALYREHASSYSRSVGFPSPLCGGQYGTIFASRRAPMLPGRRHYTENWRIQRWLFASVPLTNMRPRRVCVGFTASEAADGAKVVYSQG